MKFTISKRVVTLWGDDHLLSAFLVLVLAVRNLLWSVFSKRIILQGGQNRIFYNHSSLLKTTTNAFGKYIKKKEKKKGEASLKTSQSKTKRMLQLEDEKPVNYLLI